MTGQHVRRVVIAGGGTAGWSAAAALGKLLGPLLDITLVESEEIGTIGVGESTVPTAKAFLHLLGIDEQAFMADNRATFKLAILFENWARKGDRYIHSFGTLGRGTWMADFHHFWMEARAQGFAGELGDYCLELKAAEAHRFDKPEQVPVNYAYHIDAALYARYLRTFSEGHGVKRLEGRIERVEQDPDSGFIRALVLQSGGRLEGDLFIDCTGFRALLIEGALAAGFEDWLHWLPNDRALPVQTAAVAPPAPYTSAIAHEAGWMWRIPLQGRVGTGFVYSSNFMSAEVAQETFRARREGDVVREVNPIRFRAGRRLNIWKKNCIAIGLAGGFVEPLESTAIHLIQVAMIRLVQSFPFNGFDPALASRFNERAREEIERVRDFVVMHYKLTERSDTPFWDHCREMAIPDSLAERIELFRENAHAYQAKEELFRIDSWVQVMLGQRLQPHGHHHIAKLMGEGQLRKALDDLSRNISAAVARMPAHQTFLEQYCPAPAP